MSYNSILSAEINFTQGEQAVRQFAGTLGTIVQYLPPHFTLLYGYEAFTPKSEEFLAAFKDPDHPIYCEIPKPIEYAIFPVPAKGYNAVAVKYEWPAGHAVNLAAASDPAIFPPGPTAGHNGENFAAHVTIAYVSTASELTTAMLKEKQPDLSLFALTVDKVTLETSVKRRKKEPVTADV